MPMRGNLGAVRAPQAQNEGRAFCIHIPRNRREITSFDDRRPFQIAEVRNLGRFHALLLLLAGSHNRKSHGPEHSRANLPHLIFLHRDSSVEKLATQLGKRYSYPVLAARLAAGSWSSRYRSE